jgi:D-alanyl-D-alanine dipeptidase
MHVLTRRSSAAVARDLTSTQRQTERKLLSSALRDSGFLSVGVPFVAMR